MLREHNVIVLEFFLNVQIFRSFGTPYVFFLSRKPLGNNESCDVD